MILILAKTQEHADIIAQAHGLSEFRTVLKSSDIPNAKKHQPLRKVFLHPSFVSCPDAHTTLQRLAWLELAQRTTP